MNLQKILLIARREYAVNFRRRTFLFTAFIMPFFTMFMLGVVIYIAGSSENDMGNFTAVGLVDQINAMTDSTGKPLVTPPPPFQIMTLDAAKAALNDAKIQAYFIVGKSYLSDGTVNSVSRQSVPTGIQNAFDTYLKSAIAANAGNPDIAARLIAPLDNRTIYRIDHPNTPVDQWALIGAFILPFLFGILVYSATISTAQFLMGGVAEEKENRMMELLITSVRPTEMLWGKVLGLGALGMTQLLVWGVISFVGAAARGFDLSRVLDDLQISPAYLLLLLIYFVLSYLLTGTIMAAIGVIGDNEQEGRQLAGIIALPAILPFILSFAFITDPNGTLPVGLSLFPLTAPLSMIFRLTWGNVPPEQLAISLTLLAISVFVAVWVTARIFRLGMLSYGKRLSLRDIWTAIREGRQHVVMSTPAAKGA
jgi:ABC-2 type transport system permease protein